MKSLQEQITCWIQGKEAVVVNACAVLRNLDHHTSPFVKNPQLNQYCKNVMLNKVVYPDTVVNLLDCQLARTYGICHIIIKICEPVFNDGTKYIVTQRTCIQIVAVQSEDFYNLKLNVEPVPLGGYSHEIKRLSLLLNYNISPSLRPNGVLLHGPPGCGKTSLAKHFAQTCEAVFLKLEVSDILLPEFGVGATNLKNYFAKAVTLSKEGSVVLFIDEIDILCPGHNNASLVSKQLTCALVEEMEKLHKNNVSDLLVIAATNCISNVSALLRTPGCFDKEVLINVPTQQHRLQILEVYTAGMNLASDVSLAEVALWTVGFVGADLKALCSLSENHSNTNSFEQSQAAEVQMSDFLHAIHQITPSLKKGLDSVVELRPVKWDEIGGLEAHKAEIKEAIESPLLYPEARRRFGLSATKGILLYGPPGCCKTTLVRAAATSCNVTFLTLSGAQVYSPYVGESEKIISEAFQKARTLSPTILFFDEIESLVGSRSSVSSHSRVQEHVLTTMLNEMDGVGIRLDTKMDAAQGKKDEMETDNALDLNKSRVIVIGATNRPEMLDPAIIRPGRLDKKFYVPLPDLQSRHAILNVHTSKMPLSGVDLEELSNETEYFSGADLQNLCMEAGLMSIRENFTKHLNVNSCDFSVTHKHFLQALEIVQPSVT